jgi:hypothetical protein
MHLIRSDAANNRLAPPDLPCWALAAAAQAIGPTGRAGAKLAAGKGADSSMAHLGCAVGGHARATGREYSKAPIGVMRRGADASISPYGYCWRSRSLTAGRCAMLMALFMGA